MALALIVLAVGSVVAGYVSLGGRLEHFLEPSFTVTEGGIGSVLVFETVNGVDVEWILMGLSIVAAFGGIGIAAFYFLRSRTAADGIARTFPGLHRVLLNKYYVDEVYDATIVQPIHIVSKDALWKIVDVRVLDGAVNGVGETVGGLSEVLRRLQTGSVRAYAASVFFGAVMILGYYLWK
jgi:NADH-quinone oxidoreductase subunit L